MTGLHYYWKKALLIVYAQAEDMGEDLENYFAC